MTAFGEPKTQQVETSAEIHQRGRFKSCSPGTCRFREAPRDPKKRPPLSSIWGVLFECPLEPLEIGMYQGNKILKPTLWCISADVSTCRVLGYPKGVIFGPS